MVLGFISVYVSLQLVIGYLVSRRVANEEDYLVAGRSLGPALATASVFATWFGAETCVGAAGEVYEKGLLGVAGDPFGYGICLILFGLVVAGRLWRARVTTIADLYRARYSPGVERAVALLMVPGSVLWAAAQMRAFGTVVASATELLTVQDGLRIAAVVTIVYTMMGGLLADAWTDLLQGAVLLAALLVLAGVALAAPGAPEALSSELARGATRETSWLEQAEAWAIPILGSLFAQELAARAAAARSGALAVRASVGAGSFYLLAGLAPVSLGLLARTQLPSLEHPEAALPLLAEHHLGLIGQGIFAGALVSAILSTIDSALLAASGLVTHNLLPSLGASSPTRKLLVSRLGVLGLGAVAFVLAESAGSVYALGEEASAFGSAGFVVTGLAVLFARRGGPAAAYAALAAGVVGYVALDGLDVTAPFLGSLAAAALAYGGGVLFEGARRPGGGEAGPVRT